MTDVNFICYINYIIHTFHLFQGGEKCTNSTFSKDFRWQPHGSASVQKAKSVSVATPCIINFNYNYNDTPTMH